MVTTSSTLWNAVVLRTGKNAQDMLDTGGHRAVRRARARCLI